MPQATHPGKRTPVTALKIVSYYPADASWSAMWTRYSHSRTDRDFAAIRTLGANAVRIIVPPAAVGFPVIDSASAAELKDMVDTAQQHGLDVQLTLFDRWLDYSDIDGSTRWLRSLLHPYQGDRRIRLVELRNEIRTDDPAAMAWAKTMLPRLGRILPGVPRTVSVAGSTGSNGLTRLLTALPRSALDVIDVHIYRDPALVVPLLRLAKQLAAGRPVIIGEAGMATARIRSIATEESQARFFRLLARIAHDLAIPPPDPWILSDFTPSSLPRGTLLEQYHFGLRTVDGRWKRGANAVLRAFSGRTSRDIDGTFTRESTGFGTTFGSWRLFDVGAARVSFPVLRGHGRTGCLTSTGGDPLHAPALFQSIPLITPGTVQLAADVHLHAATGRSRIVVAFFDDRERYLGQVESADADNGNPHWQHLTVSADPPPEATSLQVHLKSSYNSGTACFDDVRLAGAF